MSTGGGGCICGRSVYEALRPSYEWALTALELELDFDEYTDDGLGLRLYCGPGAARYLGLLIPSCEDAGEAECRDGGGRYGL